MRERSIDSLIEEIDGLSEYLAGKVLTKVLIRIEFVHGWALKIYIHLCIAVRDNWRLELQVECLFPVNRFEEWVLLDVFCALVIAQALFANLVC